MAYTSSPWSAQWIRPGSSAPPRAGSGACGSLSSSWHGPLTSGCGSSSMSWSNTGYPRHEARQSAARFRDASPALDDSGSAAGARARSHSALPTGLHSRSASAIASSNVAGGRGISHLAEAMGSQQQQIDGLIDKVASMLSTMHEQVLEDVRKERVGGGEVSVSSTAEPLQGQAEQRCLSRAERHVMQREDVHSLQQRIVRLENAMSAGGSVGATELRRELDAGLRAGLEQMQVALNEAVAQLQSQAGGASAAGAAGEPLSEALRRECATLVEARMTQTFSMSQRLIKELQQEFQAQVLQIHEYLRQVGAGGGGGSSAAAEAHAATCQEAAAHCSRLLGETPAVLEAMESQLRAFCNNVLDELTDKGNDILTQVQSASRQQLPGSANTSATSDGGYAGAVEIRQHAERLEALEKRLGDDVASADVQDLMAKVKCLEQRVEAFSGSGSVAADFKQLADRVTCIEKMKDEIGDARKPTQSLDNDKVMERLSALESRIAPSSGQSNLDGVVADIGKVEERLSMLEKSRADSAIDKSAANSCDSQLLERIDSLDKQLAECVRQQQLVKDGASPQPATKELSSNNGDAMARVDTLEERVAGLQKLLLAMRDQMFGGGGSATPSDSARGSRRDEADGSESRGSPRTNNAESESARGSPRDDDFSEPEL
eukprot:TRINITY_DN1616_c0_g2_i3.p1 TRINITY_DN1616_c0_g2~~TRINITY_DN1616_c0_g2_i3.p1  ORF type:complete len:705 (-),score=157.95 TRINITY_DN1616_c0_g2_i3:22-2007(-)